MRQPTIWLIATLLIAGCKRPPTAVVPAPSPATAPAITTAAAPPATRPIGPTFMLVDSESVEFPPARVVVKQPGDKLSAMLFSIDPPEAIKQQYHGNSFYFDMPELNLEDPASINGAVWAYRAPDSDRHDSNDGLFINGRKFQLQPLNVQVLVDGESDPVRVKLSGTFLKFDDSADQPNGVRVNVRAEFDAELRK